jgi:hypothetical protein
MRTIAVRLGLCALLAGCAGAGQMRTDAALGRVVVYKNGIALFERRVVIHDDRMRLTVPSTMVDDVLKSLRIVDVSGKAPVPSAFPTTTTAADGGWVHVDVDLGDAGRHELEISYLAESPTWKPTYRVTLQGADDLVLEGWALVDNTSGEDWQDVRVAVASSAALSFRYDLHSVRPVSREELGGDQRLALAPPIGSVSYGGNTLLEAGKAQDVDALGLVAQIDELERTLVRMADEAREQRDVVKTTCLNDKRAQLAVTVTSAREHLAAVDAARASGDGASLRHELTVLAVLAERAQVLAAESQQCVGSEMASMGETQVTTTIDPALPPDDEEYARERGPLPASPAPGHEEPRAKIPEASRVTAAEEEARRQTARLALLRDTVMAYAQQGDEPVGSAHFETEAPLDLAAGQAAMIPIVKAKTRGEVVYFQPPIDATGSPSYPFRAVRLVNPTDSVLESGPLTVFGDGRFVGEGICEPIPARATAFVPFALDRQLVVERTNAESERVVAVTGVEDRLVGAEVARVRRVTYSLHHRGTAAAVAFVAHRPDAGWKLADETAATERMGGAHLFRVEIRAGGKTTIELEEIATTTRVLDVRAAADIDLLARFAAESNAQPVATVVARAQAAAELERRLVTQRSELAQTRQRLAELEPILADLRKSRANKGLLDDMTQRVRALSQQVAELASRLAGLEQELVAARLAVDDALSALQQTAVPARP